MSTTPTFDETMRDGLDAALSIVGAHLARLQEQSDSEQTAELLEAELAYRTCEVMRGDGSRVGLFEALIDQAAMSEEFDGRYGEYVAERLKLDGSALVDVWAANAMGNAEVLAEVVGPFLVPGTEAPSRWAVACGFQMYCAVCAGMQLEKRREVTAADEHHSCPTRSRCRLRKRCGNARSLRGRP